MLRESQSRSRVQEQFPTSENSSALLMTLPELFSGEVSGALFILLGAEGFVLLIAVIAARSRGTRKLFRARSPVVDVTCSGRPVLGLARSLTHSIRHRTEYSFFYENVELPTTCISDR
jgi:hypothetical protein